MNKTILVRVSGSFTKLYHNKSIIILCHPREDGDPVYNYIQKGDFSLVPPQAGDNLCQEK